MSTRLSRVKPRRRLWWRARTRGTLPLAALLLVTAVVGWVAPGQVDFAWLISGSGLYLALLLVQLARSPTKAPVWGRGCAGALALAVPIASYPQAYPLDVEACRCNETTADAAGPRPLEQRHPECRTRGRPATTVTPR